MEYNWNSFPVDLQQGSSIIQFKEFPKPAFGEIWKRYLIVYIYLC